VAVTEVHFHHWYVAFLHSSSFIIYLIWFLTHRLFTEDSLRKERLVIFANLQVGVIHNFVPHPVGAGGEIQVSLRDDHDETTMHNC